MEKIKKKLSKLTLFDKVLILAVLAAISVFAFIFFRKSAYVTAVIKVGEETVQFQPWNERAGTKAWFSQKFYKGMKETDGLGRTKAEVLDVRSFSTERGLKDVYVTVRLGTVYNRASNQHTFRGKPVLIGSIIKLNLDDLVVEGLVTHIMGANDEREKKTLVIKAQLREENSTFLETSGLPEFLASVLEIGQEIKDDQGNVIVKVLEKKVEDARRTVVTSDGRVLLRRNPLRKDIYYTLEVNALKIHDRYYLFDDVPLLVGERIPLNTSTVSITPTITDIELLE